MPCRCEAERSERVFVGLYPWVPQVSVSKCFHFSAGASDVLIDLVQCNVCDTGAGTYVFQQRRFIKFENTNCLG